MKTAEERAEDYLKKYVGTWNAKQERELVILIKEQDKITRHACAEAINKIDGDLYEAKLVEASNACMNVKAV